MNLVLSRWSNRGVNLWKVEEVVVQMPQGIAQYPVDLSVVNVLDTFLREYQMGAAQSVSPVASTISGSPLVTITVAGASVAAGSYVSITVPFSVGGLVLLGFYQVQSVPASNQFVIKAASNATSTANNPVVPSFTSVATSANISVYLPNHGYLAGQSFTVQVPTTVGGVMLQGPYQVLSVQDANDFTITSPFAAGSSQAVSENGGQTLIAVQAVEQSFTQDANPVDILLYPLSRNDWAAIPDKSQQGRPTSYWFDRTLSPMLNVWLVPDGNGPYELHYFVCRQIQDANPASGQLGNMPQRFFEAFTADVAAHLAMKWSAERAPLLAAYAKETWVEAADEDREHVPLYISPDLSGYFS
jgi:hypothetical protein